MSEVSPLVARRRPWSYVINALICLGILGAAAVAIIVINRTEPTAQTINTTRKSAALVETIRVQRGTYAPRIDVLGTVEPAQSIVLSPRVGGQVLKVSSEFLPGGMVRQGELLVSIDPSDFANLVSIRESELRQVEADLEIEEGRQSLAEQELALLGESINEINRGLVLRKPQYASIQSQVSAARAALERAQIDLQRTSIKAPFDAQVLTRTVNVGSQVDPGDALGELVGVEEYWILAAVPVRSLRWIQFPEGDRPGSLVMLRDQDAWGPEQQRPARVSRLIGTLDEQTRLARVLITAPDPLGRRAEHPPLILDTLIEVQIDGRQIENVVRLKREYVHDRDTVWVMQDEKLEIRNTEIAFRDAQYAYIREGLENGEEVVTTTLATVADGVGLRKAESAGSPQSPATAEITD